MPIDFKDTVKGLLPQSSDWRGKNRSDAGRYLQATYTYS